MTFDLERARGLRDFLQDDCAEVGDVWGEMIAEIERLRADLEQSERVIEARLDVIDQQAALTKSLKKEIRRLKHESKVEQEFTNSYIKRLHDAEARIKELGSSLDEAEALTKQNAELMNGYLGRIKVLEKNCIYDPGDGKIFVPDGHPEIERLRARVVALEDALAEYQRLGKIISESVIPCLTVHGNCDQCRPKTKAACEAIAAIRALSIILEYISYDADDDIEICSHAAVLRAMLTEAA
jgi:DNA repair exonuclease SbcCD ATPase subunit